MTARSQAMSIVDLRAHADVLFFNVESAPETKTRLKLNHESDERWNSAERFRDCCGTLMRSRSGVGHKK